MLLLFLLLLLQILLLRLLVFLLLLLPLFLLPAAPWLSLGDLTSWRRFASVWGLCFLPDFFFCFPWRQCGRLLRGISSMANCAMVLMLQKSLPRVRTRVSRQLMSPSPQRPVTPALVLIPSALSVTSAGHLKSPYLQRLTP